MESLKVKCKNGLISKTWERCKSFSGGAFRRKKPLLKILQASNITKSKSLPNNLDHLTTCNSARKEDRCNKRVAPQGCFSIYVGVEKERFVIKTEYVNHPLFKGLLEEAEAVYGYCSEGPLVIPCEVDHFVKILMQVDCSSHEEIEKKKKRQRGFSFLAASRSRSSSSYHHVTPPRMVAMNV